ncbi:MAG TPA: hypothetical protein VIN93_13870 [Bryobacteraceae bacterium]|jgi:hypothetical protein
MHLKLRFSLLAVVSGVMAAQTREPADLERILQRLDVLEQQNRELMAEIHALREQIASAAAAPAPTAMQSAPPSAPPLAERVEVAEQRIRDLAQTRVESEHHSAVQLTGMVLFNSYVNGKYGGGEQDPTTAAAEASARADGATLRQTIVGLRFQAPERVAGAEVSGDAYVDLFGGSGDSLDQLVRLRVASINFEWANTTFTVAQDKPILAPREPDSLAQVGVSPLTGAGDLWLWRPQARIEQRFGFGDSAGLRAQAGVLETSEAGNVPGEYSSYTSASRPALEGRFVFWKKSADNGDFEIAPGFHISNSQLLGYSVPSRIASVDWRIPLARAFTVTGAAFLGENMGVIGGLRQGVVVPYYGAPKAVRGAGGWAQLEYRATRRLAFHLFGGQEDDRNRDLQTGLIAKNQSYGANAMYQIVSNVVASFESAIVQTAYIGSPTRLNPHYDLAFAYLF